MVVSEISGAELVTLPCPFSVAKYFTAGYESAVAFRIGLFKVGGWLLDTGRQTYFLCLVSLQNMYFRYRTARFSK